MNINLSAIQLTDLLPQREPFLFVDKIIDFNYETYACKTAFLITENCLLVEDNRLTEAGLLENIAQSCATQIGFVNKYILKKDIQIGFIGAVKNVKITTFAPVGKTLETHIEIVTEFADMKIANCTVCVGTQIIAEGELKIALKPND
ncbi:MAG: pseudouridylate synthase [Bacteroidales bacterium]|jgi:3-hydroxymyristoyl/3-hydroxydecanoyl-(acyl carrier protein) dehydratase|nr:pseudouridylate synthase [Bacteroidales bacterium]